MFDELTNLQSDTSTNFTSAPPVYKVEEVHPAVVGALDFYYERSAWQTQWQSLAATCGEAVIVRDDDSSPVAYALFRKKFNEQGTLLSVALCQFEFAGDRDDADAIVSVVLDKIFPVGEYRRTTYNFRKSNTLIIERLLDAGFTTYVEQVHMMKDVSELQK